MILGLDSGPLYMLSEAEREHILYMCSLTGETAHVYRRRIQMEREEAERLKRLREEFALRRVKEAKP